MRFSRSKRGSSSVFLALILAALIFVHAVYLDSIIDINRRVVTERAIKQQLEQILAQYNEELFLEYGLYGFLESDINTEVYRNVIESRGYKYGENIYCDFYETLSTIQLEKALKTYYAYRGPGIVIKNVLDAVRYMFGELDTYGFADKIKNFSRAGGEKALSILGKGAGFLNEILESDELADMTELAAFTPTEQNLLGQLFNNIKEAKSAKPDFDDDFTPEDYLSFRMLNEVSDMFLKSEHIVEDDFFRLCLAHYSVENFESFVKEFDGEKDKNIRGTYFVDLNEERVNDVEYILTGYSGTGGAFVTGNLISAVLYFAQVLTLLMNDKYMSVVKKVADALSIILMVVLEGVKIPAWVFEIIIIHFSAICTDLKAMVDLYCGKSIELFKFSKAPEPFNAGISVDYKDLLLLLSLVQPQDVKLHRIRNVIKQKYGDILTYVSLTAVYGDEEIDGQSGYSLYGF